MSSSGADIIDLDREAVKAGLLSGAIVLVDVREPHEYDQAHIPGAISMPLSSFDAKALVAQDKQVVFSCMSGVRTLRAIAAARAAGFNLNCHYSGSFRDWVMAGELVEPTS